MNRLACVFIVAVVLFASSIVGQANMSFRDDFFLPTCSRTCWMGIEPGITTQIQVEEILSLNDIDYTIVPLGSTVRMIRWMPDLNVYPYFSTETWINVFFSSNTVDNISFATFFQLDAVYQSFGAPDWVLEYSSGGYTLVYEAEQIVFDVGYGTGNPRAFLAQMVTQPILDREFHPVSRVSEYLTNCSDLLVGSTCPLATATPTPTSVLNTVNIAPTRNVLVFTVEDND